MLPLSSTFTGNRKQDLDNIGRGDAYKNVRSGLFFLIGQESSIADTPKIMALLLVVKALDAKWGMLGVAVGMSLGGLINARRVAMTMSKKITSLTHGQGFAANLATSALVILASRFGMLVSTTHVSCGSLFGVGLSTRQANTGVISQIIMSWILTLPVAAVLGASLCWLFSHV